MSNLSLQEAFQKFKEADEFLSGKMKLPSEQVYYISNYKIHNQLFATYYLFYENDIDAAKNCYYEASLAEAHFYEKLNGDIFSTCSSMLLPILSDNEKVIEKYLDCDRSEHKNQELLFTISERQFKQF